MRAIARRRNAARLVAAVAASVLVAGCASLESWIPTIPVPSIDWFSSRKKPGPLPDFKATATAAIAWQVPVGAAAQGFSPYATTEAVFAAAASGAIVRVDAATGKLVWQIDAGKRLSVGAGTDPTLLVVGTDRGDVLAFTLDGKPLWTATLTSAALGPPLVGEGIVVARSGDGRTFGLSGVDGKPKWVHQQATPPLTVRNYAGGVVSRGGMFVGTAGGKLLAIDVATGNVGWEGNVATPKGATELERIADVTSLPVVEERQACAVAYQGRVACFDVVRGNLNWSRELSSLAGMAADSRYLYVTDDRGTVHALDKTTGASAWKQDKLGPRNPGGPQIVGDYLGVVDIEGYLHLLDRNDGSLVGRIATDGTAPTAQPIAVRGNAVWQSGGGILYSVGAR
jgi:outer membrane protein assembly factor BamB